MQCWIDECRIMSTFPENKIIISAHAVPISTNVCTYRVYGNTWMLIYVFDIPYQIIKCMDTVCNLDE